MSVVSSRVIPALKSLEDSKFYVDTEASNFESFYFNLLKSKKYPKGTIFKKRDKIIPKLLENIIVPLFQSLLKTSINNRVVIDKFIEITTDTTLDDSQKMKKFKRQIKHLLQLLTFNTYKFIEPIIKNNSILITYNNENITIKELFILLENYLNIRYNKYIVEGLTSNRVIIISKTVKLSANTNLNIVFNNFYFNLLSVRKTRVYNEKLRKTIDKYMMYMLIRIIIDKIKNPHKLLPVIKSRKSSNSKLLSIVDSLNDSNFYMDEEEEDFYKLFYFELLTKKIYPRDVVIDENYKSMESLFDNISISIFKDIINDNEVNRNILDKIINIYTNTRLNDVNKLKEFKIVIKDLSDILLRFAGRFILKLGKNKIQVSFINKNISLAELNIFLTNLLNMRFNRKLRYKHITNEIKYIIDNKLSSKTSLSLVYKNFFYKLKYILANIEDYINDDDGDDDDGDGDDGEVANIVKRNNILLKYIKDFKMYILARILIDLIKKRPQISKRIQTLITH